MIPPFMIKLSGITRILLSSCITLWIFTLQASGQELEDSSFYNPGIHMIRQAKTENDYLKAASYFEDLQAIHKPAQWLQFYYAALCYIHASYKAEPDKVKDELLDKAQIFIDSASKMKPEETEIFILQAFLFQSRIQVNPPMRGLSYSSKADAELKKAMAKDDGNPRAWSLKGHNVFHTPGAFGGGCSKALPIFLKARERYLTFKPELPFLPDWGQPENEQKINECRKNN